MWMRRIFLLSLWLLSADTDFELRKTFFFSTISRRLYFTCGPIFWISQVPSTSGPIGRAGRPWAALSAPGRIPGCRRGFFPPSLREDSLTLSRRGILPFPQGEIVIPSQEKGKNPFGIPLPLPRGGNLCLFIWGNSLPSPRGFSSFSFLPPWLFSFLVPGRLSSPSPWGVFVPFPWLRSLSFPQ
jgi:hypothetical protein